MAKYLVLGSLVISVTLIVSTFIFAPGDLEGGEENLNNVSMVDGKQVIEIDAKGGYSPRISIAKADTSSVIKVNTKGTFDCSSSLVIPSLGYEKNLPMTGETLIDVPPQKAGTSLQGLCSMGMYSFQVQFE